GHERRAGQIYRSRADAHGGANRSCGSDGVDAIALDADGPSFVQRVAVEDARRSEHRNVGGSGRSSAAALAAGECRKRQQNHDEKDGAWLMHGGDYIDSGWDSGFAIWDSWTIGDLGFGIRDSWSKDS